MTEISNHVEQRLTKLETSQSAILDTCRRIENKIDSLDSHYVTHVEFWPVKAIVYSGAGFVLLAALGAIVAMIIRSA